MNHWKSKFPVLAGAALLALLTLQVIQLYGATRLANRLNALEERHTALQDSFLAGSRESRAQLAASLGYRATPAATPNADYRQRTMIREADHPSVQAVFVGMKQTIAREAKDAAWAGNVQLNVRDVVQGLSQQGLDIPTTPEVHCRSQHCLISFDLGESGDEDAWIQELLTEIAGDLPQAQFVRVPSSDGSRSSLQILANRNVGTKSAPCPAGSTNCS